MYHVDLLHGTGGKRYVSITQVCWFVLLLFTSYMLYDFDLKGRSLGLGL